MHCVDLGESFQTHIYLQNLASIQPRTSPLKSEGALVDASTAQRTAATEDATQSFILTEFVERSAGEEPKEYRQAY